MVPYPPASVAPRAATARTTIDLFSTGVVGRSGRRSRRPGVMRRHKPFIRLWTVTPIAARHPRGNGRREATAAFPFPDAFRDHLFAEVLEASSSHSASALTFSRSARHHLLASPATTPMHWSACTGEDAIGLVPELVSDLLDDDLGGVAGGSRTLDLDVVAG